MCATPCPWTRQASEVQDHRYRRQIAPSLTVDSPRNQSSQVACGRANDRDYIAVIVVETPTPRRLDLRVQDDDGRRPGISPSDKASSRRLISRSNSSSINRYVCPTNSFYFVGGGLADAEALRFPHALATREQPFDFAHSLAVQLAIAAPGGSLFASVMLLFTVFRLRPRPECRRRPSSSREAEVQSRRCLA